MNQVEEPATAKSYASGARTEQPVSSPVAADKGPSTDFFVIGGIINITLIMAYFVWAFRAWKRLDRKKTAASKNSNS